MPLQDDLSRLVAIMVAQHVGGRAEQLRYAAFGVDGDAGAGRLAKAAGCSREVLLAWEAGAATPTTSEALAWMAALYAAQPRPFTANLHQQAAAAEAAKA